MNTECEIRILDIDVDIICDRLNGIGAKKIGEYNQKRYMYDAIPKEKGKFIRLRTNGEETTLTYKEKKYNFTKIHYFPYYNKSNISFIHNIICICR